LRHQLEAIEHRRARVWELDNRGFLDPFDIQERLAALKAEKEALERRLVVAAQDRAFLEAAFTRDAEAEALRSGAYEAYLEAGFLEQAQIGRDVAISLGGLRVTVDGRFIIGPSDRIWQRKKSIREALGLGLSRRDGTSSVSALPSTRLDPDETSPKPAKMQGRRRGLYLDSNPV
jgi:hypothetical protein